MLFFKKISKIFIKFKAIMLQLATAVVALLGTYILLLAGGMGKNFNFFIVIDVN